MKTIRNKTAGNLKRKQDKEARALVSTGKWEFVPKSVWKEKNCIAKAEYDKLLGGTQ